MVSISTFRLDFFLFVWGRADLDKVFNIPQIQIIALLILKKGDIILIENKK